MFVFSSCAFAQMNGALMKGILAQKKQQGIIYWKMHNVGNNTSYLYFVDSNLEQHLISSSSVSETKSGEFNMGQIQNLDESSSILLICGNTNLTLHLSILPYQNVSLKSPLDVGIDNFNKSKNYYIEATFGY